LKHPSTTVELVSAVQPQLEYTDLTTIGSRSGSAGSVISTYVFRNEQELVNKLFMLYVLQVGLLNE